MQKNWKTIKWYTNMTAIMIHIIKGASRIFCDRCRNAPKGWKKSAPKILPLRLNRETSLGVCSLCPWWKLFYFRGKNMLFWFHQGHNYRGSISPPPLLIGSIMGISLLCPTDRHTSTFMIYIVYIQELKDIFFYSNPIWSLIFIWIDKNS